MNIDKIETFSTEVFNNIAIDKIMKNNNNLTEEEAVKILNSLYNNINIFDEECYNENGYNSVRYAILNKI